MASGTQRDITPANDSSPRLRGCGVTAPSSTGSFSVPWRGGGDGGKGGDDILMTAEACSDMVLCPALPYGRGSDWGTHSWRGAYSLWRKSKSQPRWAWVTWSRKSLP